MALKLSQIDKPNRKLSEKTNLFISYSHKDRPKVEKLCDALDQSEQLNVFRDTNDIFPSEEWKPRIKALIKAADTIIFALSPHSINSEVCKWELEYAEQLNKRIIPVVIEDVDGNVPVVVSKMNYIFLTANDELNKVLPKIQSAINLDIYWIREHTRLGNMAQRWDRAAQLGAQRLRGKELEAAENWLAIQPTTAPMPTQMHRSYILASRKASTKRQCAAVISSLAVMIVVAILGGMAWQQRNSAIAQKEAAQTNESRNFVEKAERAVEKEDYATAMRHAYAALPHDEKLGERPILETAERMLREAFARNLTQTEISQDQSGYFPYYMYFAAIGENYVGLKNLYGLDIFRAADGFRPTHISFDPMNDGSAKPCILGDRFLVTSLASKRADSLTPKGGFAHEGPGLGVINVETLDVQVIPLAGGVKYMGCLEAQNKVVFVTNGSVFGMFDLNLATADDPTKFQTPDLMWVQFPEPVGQKDNVPDWLKNSFDEKPAPREPETVQRIQLSEHYGSNWYSRNSGVIEKLFLPENGENVVVFGVSGFRQSDQFCKVALDRPLIGQRIACASTNGDFGNMLEWLVADGKEVIDIIRDRAFSVDDGSSRQLPIDNVDSTLRATFRYGVKEFVVGFHDRDFIVANLSDGAVVHQEAFTPAAQNLHPNDSVKFEIKFDERSGLLALDIGRNLHVYDAANGFELLWSVKLAQGNHVERMFFAKDNRQFFTSHGRTSYLETRDVRSGKLLSRAFIADTSAISNLAVEFAQTDHSDGVAHMTSKGIMKIIKPLPRGMSRDTNFVNRKIGTGVFSHELNSFVTSNFDGLHLVGGEPQIAIDGADVHKKEVIKQLTAVVGLDDSYYTPERIEKDLSRGNAAILLLNGTHNTDRFLTYGGIGPAYVWALSDDGVFKGKPLAFDDLTLRANARKSWIYPNIKRAVVSPNGDLMAAIVSGNEAVCVYNLSVRKLLFCNQEGEYHSVRWQGDQTLALLYNGHDGAVRNLITFDGAEHETTQELLEGDHEFGLGGGRYLSAEINDKNSRHVVALTLRSGQDRLTVDIASKENYSVNWYALMHLSDAAIAVQGGYIALPVELNQYANLGSRQQIAFVDVVTGRNPCLFSLTINTRPTYGSNILNHIPDSNLFVLGPRAMLVDVGTCTVLEELNSAPNSAIAVGIVGQDIQILLSNGGVLHREIRPVLGEIIQQAGAALDALKE